MLVELSDTSFFNKKRSLNYDGQIIWLERPQVMGIVNLTPDSFYDGGRYTSVHEAIYRVGEMVGQGADWIDLGATSTRPGAAPVDAETEMSRLKPVLQEIKKSFPQIKISVDTYHSLVVRELFNLCGAFMVNDISGGLFDPEMASIVASLGLPYIVMHIKGTPADMQENPQYQDVTKEVIRHLSERVYRMKEAGINDLIIDPGFGFGKDLDHNYELFNHLDSFRIFELPILVGVSRKSMLYKLLGSTPDNMLNATTALNTLALLAGVDFLRVHDVKEAVEAFTIVDKLKQTTR